MVELVTLAVLKLLRGVHGVHAYALGLSGLLQDQVLQNALSMRHRDLARGVGIQMLLRHLRVGFTLLAAAARSTYSRMIIK